ncbi:MAG: hypothetical protein A3F11_09990 [Gammaproteobacteria bacterium RIFCSPHIGHO2_12_FULL_37_14]|nr:MAG: hypothetical protein A3F11_09990 [Gammaproteobacteria bacterium RIFCSPHIGHO2_12_FULL_37_14]
MQYSIIYFSYRMLIFLLLFFANVVYAGNQIEDSPIGYWKTIDDVTGKPKAIVQILEGQDKLLSGRIIKIFPQPGYDQYALCTACHGERHNQRIVGMIFLKNLKKSQGMKNLWANGEILDPKNGKLYRSTIRLLNNGQKLNVRGYIGLPLFGRTQTWIKESGS